MRAYDRTFSPPVPVAEVAVIHLVTGISSGLLEGKLDTGADITVIPESLISKLGFSAKAYLWARGYDGTFWHRPVYYVRLEHRRPRTACRAASLPTGKMFWLGAMSSTGLS